MRLKIIGLICLGLTLLISSGVMAAERLRLATTTSTENSGLLDVLLPPFEKAYGMAVHAIPVGTGKALAIAKRCDADLVMVHAPALEKRFVADGYGVKRVPFMYNYFAVVGPADDPAGVAKCKNAIKALQRIAEAKAIFISRGDNSGTNVKEKEMWKAAGIKPDWPGYKETGRGMGATLTMAGQLGGYTLTDSGTFLKYKSVGKLDLEIHKTQTPSLKNPYSVILVNPARCPKVNTQAAQAFIDFLTSPQGQKIIAAYKAGGRQLFWPNANKAR